MYLRSAIYLGVCNKAFETRVCTLIACGGRLEGFALYSVLSTPYLSINVCGSSVHAMRRYNHPWIHEGVAG